MRSFIYAGTATLIALLIAYPLAYAIALRAGRWKLLLLFAVIAPFFTTYLIRTIAWKTILADQSPVVDVLQFLQLVPEDGRVLATGGAVIAGLTYNFLPFMILPIYASLERIDTSLIEAGKDLYASVDPDLPAGDPADHHARDRRRGAAHLHPRGRRLRQRRDPRRHRHLDDRQRDPVALPRAAQLPGGGGAVVPDDGWRSWPWS